ncbi:MAG TPA: hypothetical protein VM802_03890 [Chitinophaga sp.]|uniref:hypothetical protein n=1 Tax=Chitinophaga sp. TaxID=1869181 RepID=UPI002CAB7619|nr:hypothetical protein [Chitinophaga sp.]HVI43977.1 hypothetical protein [Chitinophaga sp.]
MKMGVHPLFAVGCLLWLVVRLSRELHHPLLSFVNGHLTDFLAVPVIGYMCLMIFRNFFFGPSYSFPMWYSLFIALYLAVVFEYALPLYSARYTGDWADVLAYIAGAGCFNAFMNKAPQPAASF